MMSKPLRLLPFLPPAYAPAPPGGERPIDLSKTEKVVISLSMFDDVAGWQVVPEARPGGYVHARDLSLDELRRIEEAGVVIAALVKYPRADRYGLPDEATVTGFLNWLRNEQRLWTCATSRFRFRSKDRGDDSPMDCVLTVRIPKGPPLQTELF